VNDSVAIADAVVARLASGTFAPSFVPVRGYVPQFDLAELRGLHVTVVPRALPEERTLDRSSVTHVHEVDVAIQQRVAVERSAEIDVLMDLVQTIHDWMRGETLDLADGRRVAYVGATREPLYSAAHLREFRCFTAVLTLSYEVTR